MAFNAGDIESTLTLDRSPFNEGLLKARADAERFEKRGIKLKVDVDKSFTGQIQRAINETQKSTGKGIRLPVQVDKATIDEFKKKVDDIADNTETTARRSGNRVARALLNPVVVQLGLLPAIAMASAGAAGLALGVLPVAFAAIGVAALKSNEDLALSYSQMWQDIKSDATDIAEPLIDTFEKVSHKIYESWHTLRPELAQLFKDIDPLILDLTDGVLGFAEEALPRFRQAISQSGPIVRGLESLLRSTGAGLGELTVNASQNSVAMGQSVASVGRIIEKLLATVGTLINQFGVFWSRVGPQFEATFDQALAAVTLFTEGGLRGVGDGMQVVLTIVQALLSAIGPFADIFGQLGGYAIAASAGFKLLTGVFGLLGKAWKLIAPAEMATRLQGVSKSIQNISTKFGEYVAVAYNSATAGEKAESAIRKIGNAAVKAITWLPLLGTAIAAGAAAVDHFWPSAETLAEKIGQGGAAAAEARTQMIDYGNSVNTGNVWATAFAATSDEVKDALDKQRSSMTEVERAQMDVTKAQNDYQYAVDKFGENSPQARRAQLDLASATDYLAIQQDKAAEATEDHTDAIIRQTTQMLASVGGRLGYQQSLLNMEQAQRDLTKAVEEHGVGSLEARQADIQYQQSILQAVNSLGERVKAENASKGAAEANRIATLAMHQEIARLAVEAGVNLPPALAQMAAGLSDGELAAMGVTKEVDNAGNAIYRLPPGKSLAFPNDAPIAQQQVANLQAQIDHLPTYKWFNYYINYITSGTPPSKAALPSDPSNQGTIPFKARGGPVRANMPYWVGDEGGGIPELFFPNVDGFILNGKDSARLSKGLQAQAGRGRNSPSLPMGGDGASQQDPTQLIEMIAAAIAAALQGATLNVDGSGIATLVNRVNLRNGGR